MGVVAMGVFVRHVDAMLVVVVVVLLLSFNEHSVACCSLEGIFQVIWPSILSKTYMCSSVSFYIRFNLANELGSPLAPTASTAPDTSS